MKRITLKKAKEMAKVFNVDLKVVDIHDLRDGIQVEMEHGLVDPRTNVSYDDLYITTQIALAHLEEYPDYYQRLEKMEKQAEKYWSKRKKPTIFKS